MKDISPLTQYPLSCSACDKFTSIAAADILGNSTQSCRHCQQDIIITDEVRRAVKRTLTSLQCCYSDSRDKDLRDSLDDQETNQA